MYEAGAPLALIVRELDRTADAVSARRRALGVAGRRSSPPWSALEATLLREAARPRVPATGVARRRRRPVAQVRVRRRRLGLARPRSRRYTAAEDAVIRTEWLATGDVTSVARRLGRRPDAVRLRAAQLGLHRPVRRRRWSRTEDAIVRDGYADGLTCSEIAAGLEHRTPTAIAARARKLGLATYARAWTGADDARLGRILAARSTDDAARLLGRTPEAVRGRARRLGITASVTRAPARAGARWSEGEDALLVLHAGLNPAMLSALLDRSDQAIAQRLRRLGLRTGRWRSPHHPSPANGGFTPGERALIERELRDRGPRAIASLEDRLERPLGNAAELARRPQQTRRAAR